MLEVVKAATLVGILVSDLLKMRSDVKKIKRTFGTRDGRARLIEIVLILVSAAAPLYYTLELQYCLMGR